MISDRTNINSNAFFTKFAERCRKSDIGVVMCEADGSIRIQGDNYPKAFIDYIFSQSAWKNAPAELKSMKDGESKLITLIPGVEAFVIVSAPRKSQRIYVVCLFVDADMEAYLTNPESADIPAEVSSAAIECYRSCGGTTIMERQRLHGVLEWWYQDLKKDATQDAELGNLSEELANSYEVISLLLRIGEKMNVAQQPIEFIRSVCEELREGVGFRWVGARLLPGLLHSNTLAGGLVSEGDSPSDRATLIQQTTELLITHNLQSANVLNTDTDPEFTDYRALGRKILAHPLMCGDQLIGGIFACDKIGDVNEINWGDIKMVEAAASHLQIFLDNASLYEDVNLMFIGTLDALTASIDAKDPYTCGHSRRVAYMSRSLAEAIGLDAKIVDRIHIAGLVHDVGKIGIPEAILRKPGKLTDEEFEVIKRHPDIGARILRDIPRFEDVLPGVLYHHERYDGKGYPRGLKGEGIPLFGRIIAVADSFDAMSSTRQYRQAMPREKVLEEIRNGRGTQFDPDMAAAFLTLDYQEYDRMTEEDMEKSEFNDAREAA